MIVVITILAILGTIAFLSFWNFTISARDSTRISDIKNMQSTLDNFFNKTWFYPNPTSPVSITYSWWIVFTHWTFWKDNLLSFELSKVPLDPLFSWI